MIPFYAFDLDSFLISKFQNLCQMFLSKIVIWTFFGIVPVLAESSSRFLWRIANINVTMHFTSSYVYNVCCENNVNFPSVVYIFEGLVATD